ncbi:serine/threonine-protein kinase HipA [Bradyrhizobium sp. USDA 4461]
MSKFLNVLMGGVPIGRLEQMNSGVLGLQYADRWLAADRIQIPLSMSLPLAARKQSGAKVANYLWNLLPDNDQTLQKWGQIYGVSPNSAFALLSKVGEDCAGAIQIVTDEWMAASAGSPGEVQWIDDAEVGSRLKRLREERTWTGRRDSDRGHFSLAGAQPKMALLFDGKRWGVPSGRRATTHILKPPMPHLRGTIENEYACLRLASRVGITSAEVKVGKFGEEIAIVVTRYDREIGTDGVVRRFHQEDMCQALGVHPATKYQSEGGPSIEQISNEVLRYATDPEADKAKFAEMVAFNFLVLGTDAHAKNFSVVHLPGRRMYLAPLYDVLSFVPYDDDEHERRRLRMAMKIGGYYKFSEIQPRHWERQAKLMQMDPDEMIARLVALAGKIPDALSSVVKEARSGGLKEPVLDAMLDGISARCEAIAKQYGATAAPAP